MEKFLDVPCWWAYHVTRDLPAVGEERDPDEQLQLLEASPPPAPKKKAAAPLPLFAGAAPAPAPSVPSVLAFVDLEHTGGSWKKGARVWEVAVCRAEQGQPMRWFWETLSADGVPINPHVEQLTGVRSAELRGKRRFKDAAPDVAELLRGALLVAHNAVACDRPFLQMEFDRAGLPWESPGTIDTLHIARNYWPKGTVPSHSLGDLAAHLGFSRGQSHRAKGDVETLLGLWRAIRKLRPEVPLAALVRSK